VLPVLDVLFQKNPIQVVVGGSGLYVDAVLKGFDVFPEVSDAIKQAIETRYQLEGISYLQHQLSTLDPDYYKHLEENNPQTLVNQQRMKRFVAVCQAANAPYSSFLNKNEGKRNFTPIIIGLEAPRAQMYERINLRVDQMMDNGLLEEVQALYPNKQLNALQTVGYRELFSYLEGDFTLEAAVEEIKKNTRRFAKRQMTWFQRTENIQWFDYTTDTKTIISYIQQQIS